MSVRFVKASVAALALLLGGAAARANEPSYGPNTYDRTLEALIAHEDIAVRGGWPKVPAGITALKPDAQGPEVAALKQRLVLSGDLPADALPGDVY
ncbi:MAG: hypothetical protein Q8S58_06980, partial [Bosea sp. (in: a-proteobacteria)]|nr:hypothetical protein [Bosea sp. (in: a-proteobacteria)]